MFEQYPIKDRLILLENEIRGFYADAENKKLFTKEDFERIDALRTRQNADYDSMQLMYFIEEVKLLKSIKERNGK